MTDRPVRDDEEIEITPQMIEAGVYELREASFGSDLEEVVRKVFLMMALESQQIRELVLRYKR